jgi:hypothetical protein
MLDNDLKCKDCHEIVPGGTDGLIQNTDVRQRVNSYVRDFARNQLVNAGQKRELDESDAQEDGGGDAKIPKTE